MPIQRLGRFTLLDLEPDTSTMAREVLAGLSENPKRLPAKFFYDRAGSRLFEEICELPEYYPTRTELKILEAHVEEMAAALGERALIVELGSGDGRKTRRLLSALNAPVAYLPVDISRDALIAEAERLAGLFPNLELLPVCADYTRPFSLPRPSQAPAQLCFYFPGSTIGNLEPEDAIAFLRHLRALAGGPCRLLLGVDLKKSTERLDAAYNDARGVTAAFNLNLLARLNRELGATFDLSAFKHRAFYAPAAGRVEMHLEALRAQTVRVAEKDFEFAAGECVCTEHSYKYDRGDVARLCAATGFTSERSWTDDEKLFGVELLVAA